MRSCAYASAPRGWQNHREKGCFYEDFSGGWNASRVTLSLNHGCCMENSYAMSNGTFYPPNGSPVYSGNIGIETQDVEYVCIRVYILLFVCALCISRMQRPLDIW